MKIKLSIILTLLFLFFSCSIEKNSVITDCPCNTIDKNDCYSTPCIGEQKESNVKALEEKENQKEKLSEEEKIKIDEYNFNELEKAKPILESMPKDAKKFYTLKEFNSLYNTNIKPIKNCYYVSNDNGNEPYIFGFELYSNRYKEIYSNLYYTYPKYDLSFAPFCGGGNKCDDDFNLIVFGNTISNPCQD